MYFWDFIFGVKWFLEETDGDQFSPTECNHIITSFTSTVIYLHARTALNAKKPTVVLCERLNRTLTFAFWWFGIHIVMENIYNTPFLYLTRNIEKVRYGENLSLKKKRFSKMSSKRKDLRNDTCHVKSLSLTNNPVHVLCPEPTSSVHTIGRSSVLFVRHMSQRSWPAFSSILHSKRWVPSPLCSLRTSLNSIAIKSPVAKFFWHGSYSIVFKTSQAEKVDCRKQRRSCFHSL